MDLADMIKLLEREFKVTRFPATHNIEVVVGHFKVSIGYGPSHYSGNRFRAQYVGHTWEQMKAYIASKDDAFWYWVEWSFEVAVFNEDGEGYQVCLEPHDELSSCTGWVKPWMFLRYVDFLMQVKRGDGRAFKCIECVIHEARAPKDDVMTPVVFQGGDFAAHRTEGGGDWQTPITARARYPRLSQRGS